MIAIPYPLISSIETGECVLFLGAGVGFNLHRPDGSLLPTAYKLTQDLAKEYKIEIPAEYSDLAKIASLIEIRNNRIRLETSIKSRLADVEPDDTFLWLCNQRWRAIYTTNYDAGVQRAYSLTANPPQTLVIMETSSDILNIDVKYEVPVFHIHGTLFGSESPNIIVTEEDYTKFRAKRKMMFNLLQYHFATSTILYIGYSHQDFNWNLLMTEIAEDFLPNPMPRAFRVDPNTDSIQMELLQHKNVHTILANFDEFVEAISHQINPSNIDRHKIKNLQDVVPQELKDAAQNSPAATSRLLGTWHYLQIRDFNGTPNITQFLNGDRPNWSLLVDEKNTFRRDIEESIWESFLDYATRRSNFTLANVVLAPAGYGTTTLIMKLATRIVKEKIAPVFVLKPGVHVIREGDLEFAAKVFPEHRVVFVIDDAADYSEEIRKVIKTLRELNLPGFFLLGSRLNEWRNTNRTPTAEEFQIEPLSDPEIHRLLDLLKTHNKLNLLANLSIEERFNVIKNKHQKELLVAMKEAKEGTTFDAIIDDEFRKIPDHIAKRAYLYVCCFNQYGVLVRDTLLAELLELSVIEMYDIIQLATEGVIKWDDIGFSGRFGARARHRTIAKIVWQRYGSNDTKDQIILNALEKLNFSFGTDKKAFNEFVRADDIVDDISTLEGRIKFFDKAVVKDVDNPYVRQHYSRMLLRDNKYQLALSQIDSALKLGEDKKALHHTKGKILQAIAISQSNTAVARKYLVQSEACFLTCIRIASRDSYGYQGLVLLYLEWAQYISDPQESVEYINKAEEWINEGLDKSYEKDSLYLASADLKNLLRDDPAKIHALENALQDNPNSTIARYLLGQAYTGLGRYDDSVKVLQPVIDTNFEAYRVFIEYIIAKLHLDSDYDRQIAILQHAETYGVRDTRYIATLGGLQYLAKRFDDAEKTFNKIYDRNFKRVDQHRINFIPPNANEAKDRIRLSGMVVENFDDYCFIDTTDYPRIFCHGSNYNSIIMRIGMKVEFTLAFSAKGSSAIEPTILPK